MIPPLFFPNILRLWLWIDPYIRILLSPVRESFRNEYIKFVCLLKCLISFKNIDVLIFNMKIVLLLGYYNITNQNGKVVRFCLLKSSYRLGEDIIGVFDFSKATAKCVQVRFLLNFLPVCLFYFLRLKIIGYKFLHENDLFAVFSFQL